MTLQKIHYELGHVLSRASVALFAPRPRDEENTLSVKALLDRVSQRPRDSFFHAFTLKKLLALAREERSALYKDFSHDEAASSLLLVAALLQESHKAREDFSDASQATLHRLARLSPLNYGRVLLQDDHRLHQHFVRAFRTNRDEHIPLHSLEIPETNALLAAEEKPFPVSIAHLRQEEVKTTSEPLPPAMQVFKEAMHKLYSIGAISGQEMRHQASLSPWAIQRNWMLDVATTCGANTFRLSGLQTSYGRGLELEGARVSCAMEIVERFSSYAVIDKGTITSTARPYTLIQGSYEELCQQGKNPLNPASLCLEAPYAGESLYWLEGQVQGEDTEKPACIPVQCAFLFSNLDESDLFSGLSSTGLASGTLMDQAKVNAIVEVMERDSTGTHLFDPAACFRITTDDPQLESLLTRYANLGIEIQFQDITGEMGVPCYRCYVIGKEGRIISGTAAHLDGKKALVAAMTETPYPFPGGPKSQRDPRELPVKKVEDLPDFSTGSPTGDRILLETLLRQNGLAAYYVDLTSKRLGFPVVRAIIPGLEIMTDFDEFSRISPRLLGHYLRLTSKI